MNRSPVTKLSTRAIIGCGVAFVVIPAVWIALLTHMGEPLSAILPGVALAVFGFGSYVGFGIWMMGKSKEKKELCLRTRADTVAARKKDASGVPR